MPPRTDAAAPASKALDVGEPPTCEAHIGTLPILQTPIGELHTVDTPIRDAPVVKPHVVQTPIVTPPIGAPHIRGVKKSWPHKIRLTRTAQDGHSASEQAVYRALWDAAAPDVNDTRVVSIGYRTIASIVGLDPSNVKPALQSLQRKLAIDLIAQEDIHSCQARTYRVHPYKAILECRRQAGLVCYQKGKGVELLTISGSPIGGTPIGDPPTVGETPTHLGNPRDKKETTTTVVTALRQVFGHADDDAARLIIAGCLAAPDLTDEEIVFFIHQARSLDRPEVRMILQAWVLPTPSTSSRVERSIHWPSILCRCSTACSISCRYWAGRGMIKATSSGQAFARSCTGTRAGTRFPAGRSRRLQPGGQQDSCR